MNILEIRTQHVKHRRQNSDYKGSNSPPLMHDDQIPHPREGKGCQMPGVCPGGGGGFKLRFDRYINLDKSFRSLGNCLTSFIIRTTDGEYQYLLANNHGYGSLLDGIRHASGSKYII